MIIKEGNSLFSNTEGQKLPGFMYAGLDDKIRDSKFWEYPNTIDDQDMENIGGEWHDQTPAAEVLGWTIEEYIKSNKINISIAVISVDPIGNENIKLPIEIGDTLYPDRLVIGGSQSVTGKGTFLMYLYLAPVSDEFNKSDVNPEKVSKIVGNIVRHEIIHADQMEKRRKNQKISRLAAKDKFRDEGEIPDSNSNRADYLGSKIEIDAYAHEFAEELLQKYGKEKSLNILRGHESLETLDLSDQFKEYLDDEELGQDSVNRLKNKIYSHIIDLTSREIYDEAKKKKRKNKNNFKSGGSYPDETYETGTEKNLYLDRSTSHGGWPEGPSKSFTSNKPVVKQISGWLKKMKMIDENRKSKNINIGRREIREMIFSEMISEGMLSKNLGIEIPYGDHIDEDSEDAASQSDKRQDVEDELVSVTANINKDQESDNQVQKKVDQDQLRGVQTSLSNFS